MVTPAPGASLGATGRGVCYSGRATPTTRWSSLLLGVAEVARVPEGVVVGDHLALEGKAHALSVVELAGRVDGELVAPEAE